MTEDNIEVGICNEAGFRRLSPAEVKDYLAAIAQNNCSYTKYVLAQPLSPTPPPPPHCLKSLI